MTNYVSNMGGLWRKNLQYGKKMMSAKAAGLVDKILPGKSEDHQI